MQNNQFQLVKIEGGPADRGFQYGKQAREKICSGIETYQRVFIETMNLEWAVLLKRAKEYIPYLTTEVPELMEETAGIAEGAGVSIEDILAINIRYEVLRFRNECTSTVVLPEASLNNSTILAQNWDFRPWALCNSLLLSITYEDGTKIFGLAEAGQLIRNGFNNYGIGVCVNGIKSIYDSRGIGLPVTFARRKLLICKGFEDAVRTVIKAKRTVANNYLIASKEGKAVNLETIPDKVYKLFPRDGIYAHANHLQADENIDKRVGHKIRDKRLTGILSEKIGSITIEDVKKGLQNHDRPDPICRHSDSKKDRYNSWQTNATVIYELALNKAHVSYGPPCEGQFIEYNL